MIMGADDNRAMNLKTSMQGAVVLPHLGVIRAKGADAARFLHSQLTNDFSSLGLSQARLAGLCSAKGRLLASFLACKPSDDEVLLVCSASLLPATLKRLSMFVLRMKCTLSDASADVPLLGLAGRTAETAMGGLAMWSKQDDVDGWTIRLPDVAGTPRCLRGGREGQHGDEPQPDSTLTLEQWQWLEVQSGVARIEAATVEQFVPQMLNFELIGAVDFKKGCYPGQEVVARSQYRGTLKRRLFLFDCDALAAAGQEVFHSADPGQPAGMVVNAAAKPIDAGSSALVEVKLSALQQGSLHLGGPKGPSLRRSPMPYEVPLEPNQPA
jgi:folate-binding protein YgfZ